MLPFALNYAQCRQRKEETQKERKREGGSERAPYVLPRTSLPLINVTLITWPRVCWLHLRSLCTLFAHSALESLVVALNSQSSQNNNGEWVEPFIKMPSLLLSSLCGTFLSCVVCSLCWLEALRKINTHTNTERDRDTEKWHEWERERETGKWKLATGKGSRQMHLENRHTKWTCVGSCSDDNWARQKTTQIRCSTTTDCRSRETQKEWRERERGR